AQHSPGFPQAAASFRQSAAGRHSPVCAPPAPAAPAAAHPAAAANTGGCGP
ncbi:hypothetical protein M9458_013943, partial [Cirrhinus mrigala]